MFFKKPTGVSWLVAGLGNPGSRYARTRHNAGFMTLDIIAGRCGVKLDMAKFGALCKTAVFGGEKVLLMKPQTFMNVSGDAVAQAGAFYKVPLERTLVIFDDVSLPLGKLRIRREGGAGGHNGLKSIIARCGGQEFPRVKIGVGEKPHPAYDMADWVLSGFSEQELKVFEPTLLLAADAAEAVLRYGCEDAANRFN